MKNPKLSNRYAKALFDFALERKQLEDVYQDLTLVLNVLKENDELQTILNSPVIVPSKKHTIFTSIFKETLCETTFSFLDVIIRKKREPMLSGICCEFIKYYNEYHKIKVATLTCAEPLSDELTEKLKNFLTSDSDYAIELRQVVDKDIIGGFILKMDDFYYDNSIASKINKLRQEFAHNIYQVNF